MKDLIDQLYENVLSVHIELERANLGEWLKIVVPEPSGEGMLKALPVSLNPAMSIEGRNRS